MAGKKYDLVIAYRIYPGMSKNTYMRDKWADKYEFAELCLKSLAKSLGDINFKIYAILDGCDNYEPLFKGLFDNVEFIKFSPSIANKATFSAQIDVLLRQDESEMVYFAEDDYLYQDNTFPEMLDFLSGSDVDFVTPYDHPDYYRRKDLHNCKSEVVFHGKRHWKTAISTCLTFLTKKQVLKEAERPCGLIKK